MGKGMSPRASVPKYRWLDHIKSEGGPPEQLDRHILVTLGGWLRVDDAWSDKQPTIPVLARQTAISSSTVKERLQRMDGVWFDRKKVGLGYRYRLRFPTAEEQAAMPSISEFRSSGKGHQFVSQSANGNRDTKSGERDTSLHPIKGRQLVSPRPIPKRIDNAPAREADVNHARQALADQGENPCPNDELHPCMKCETMIGGGATICAICHLKTHLGGDRLISFSRTRPPSGAPQGGRAASLEASSEKRQLGAEGQA